jgi:hypothetical protein
MIPAFPIKVNTRLISPLKLISQKQVETFDFVSVDANYGILPRIFGHELPTQVKFEFPLAGAKEHGDPLRVGIGAAQFGLLVANGGVDLPIQDPQRHTTGLLGFGAGRAITRYLAAMGEIRTESSFDFKRERLVVVNFGVMRRVRRNVLLYANVGRSVFSDDGLTHTYAGVGVKFLLAPKDLNSPKKESAASVLW